MDYFMYVNYTLIKNSKRRRTRKKGEKEGRKKRRRNEMKEGERKGGLWDWLV